MNTIGKLLNPNNNMENEERKQNSLTWFLMNIEKLYDEISMDKKLKIMVLFEIAHKMYNEENMVTENTSDGYHTFKELYEIRQAYNVALFNAWAKLYADYNVHKSRRHFDGEYPDGDENWFIVSAELPTGQISNHYHIEDWDLFKIPETPKALFKYDGHTTQDVIDRLLRIQY